MCHVLSALEERMRNSRASGQGRLFSIVLLARAARFTSSTSPSSKVFFSRVLFCGVLASSVLSSGGQVSAQSQPSDNPSSFNFSGTVVNSVSREPIGRALVYSADERYAAFTDDHGHFELTISGPTQGAEEMGRVVPGEMAGFGPEMALQAKKPGFLSDRGSAGHAFLRATTKEVSLSLVPEALIVGKVTFSSEETAHQGQVALYRREVRDGFGRWEQVSEVRTRSNGEYRFAELREGQYRVFTAEAEDRDPLTTGPGAPMYGFPPRFFATARDFASADVIELHAGETVTANMTPERQPYYEVKIPVVVPQPADWGLTVSVRAQGHRGPGFELGYDPNQHAIRGSLPNGTYTIEASSTGPAAATGITNITIANGPVFGPVIALAANPSVEVNVRAQISTSDSSQKGMPAPTANVTLQSADEYSGEQAMYGVQTGMPTLSGVKPGRYWVQVQPSASNLYPASVTSGLTDLLRAPLVVPVGASVPPIEIVLRDDAGDIEATVEATPEDVPAGVTASVSYSGPMRGRGFDPMGGIYVYAIPVGGAAVRWFNARNNGKYIAQAVPPGEYRVMAFDSSQEIESRNPTAMRAYESLGQVVHVAAGKATQVTLKPITSE